MSNPLVTFRCPPELLAELQTTAHDEDRSVSAQIVRFIRQGLRPRTGSGAKDHNDEPRPS